MDSIALQINRPCEMESRKKRYVTESVLCFAKPQIFPKLRRVSVRPTGAHTEAEKERELSGHLGTMVDAVSLLLPAPRPPEVI